MRTPPLDLPVQHILLINLESPRIPYRTAITVVQALLPVLLRVRLFKQLVVGRRGCLAAPQDRRHE